MRHISVRTHQAFQVKNSACDCLIWKTVGGAGKPVAFKLMPANTQPLLAAEDSTAYSRAGFSKNSLWVTQADDTHRWPGGEYPLQNPTPGGLQDWVEEVRSAGQLLCHRVIAVLQSPAPPPVGSCLAAGAWKKLIE